MENEEDEKYMTYRVEVKTYRPYHNDNNYRCEHMELDYITAGDLEHLYEYMGEEYVRWQVRAENRTKGDRYWNPEDYRIEFGDICMIVEEYNENKMKASKAYLNLGAARDKFLADEKLRKEQEKVRAAEWEKQQKEAWDKKEYERLSVKFGK